MRVRMISGAAVAALLLASGTLFGADIRSGPQVGGHPIPFNPLHCNGSTAGQKLCLVWKNGNNPVAMIFAREVTDSLTSLVKKLDKATAANKSARMGSFVVFLSNDEGLEKKLQALAKKENLKHTILTIDNVSGPRGYNIAKEADVTVVLYRRKTVKVNHAYKKGQFKKKDADQVIKELSKILPKK